MPEHDGGLSKGMLTAVGVHVGTTDPAGPDIDQDVVGLGERLVDLLDLDVLDVRRASRPSS